MAKIKLTKRIVDSTACPEEGQLFLRDKEISGFAVRLTKGQKSFILEKRINGRTRRITLGPYGALSVEMARKMAAGLFKGRIQHKRRFIGVGDSPSETSKIVFSKTTLPGRGRGRQEMIRTG